MAGEKPGYLQPPDQVARMADLRRGLRKSRKIIKVLETRLGPPPWRGVTVVDVGCGPGVIARSLARYGERVIGVDIDAATVAEARRRFPKTNLSFFALTSQALPLPDGGADVVVCNHVYEHAADAAALFREIRRVLSPTGVVYLAAAGKYQLLEPHYKLPLLSWLPARWADAYLRLLGRREGYRIRLLPYKRLMSLLGGFNWQEYTAAILASPARFGAGEALGPWGRVSRVLAIIARTYPRAVPTRVFLLTPKDEGPAPGA